MSMFQFEIVEEKATCLLLFTSASVPVNAVEQSTGATGTFYPSE